MTQFIKWHVGFTPAPLKECSEPKLVGNPEAEFKEFEPWLNYGWFHIELNSIFQELSRRSIKTGLEEFETRLKFIKFGHRVNSIIVVSQKSDFMFSDSETMYKIVSIKQCLH